MEDLQAEEYYESLRKHDDCNGVYDGTKGLP